MAVPISSGASIESGAPSELFQTPLPFLGSQGPDVRASYAVTKDGKRFLLNMPQEHPSPPITVVLNWTAGLKK